MLGTRGLRRLTHRTVDAEARLPTGLWTILSTLHGLMTGQLAAPDPEFAPERAILTVLRGILAA